MSNEVFFKNIPDLLSRHYEQLSQGSGLANEVIRERGYKSVLGTKKLEEKGFNKQQRRIPTLLIPIHGVDGSQPFFIHRPDTPRKNNKGKEIKYENPPGINLRFDVPPRCREHLINTTKRLLITEGVKKADSLASKGEVVIDLLGVWGFKSKNSYGATTISADFDYIAWQERDVYIVFDNDVMINQQVKKALEVLSDHLRRKGAKVHHIIIPYDNRKKVGVDDYLLGHSIEDLMSHAITQDKIFKMQSDPKYFIDNYGYLCREKYVQGVPIPIKLANFDAQILKEISEDNGLEITYKYEIAGAKKTNSGSVIHLSKLIVPASSFSSMNWVYQWGASAIIEPGSTMKDMTRHAIQTRSNPEKIKVFTHTGFVRIDGNWEYLTWNGAIGREDVKVNLPQELNRYSLPSAIEDEMEAIQASFSFLELGNKLVVHPLFANLYLSPLTTMIKPMPNYVTLLSGETGTLKTTLGISQLSHFGKFTSIENLSNFDDTANQLGRRTFILKDMLMLLDDFHPSTQRYVSQQKEATFQRLIREVANRTERGRLNPDASEKARYSPRCNLLITAEDQPSQQSTIARTFTIEIERGDISLVKLTEFQKKHPLLPHAMTSYILWLKENMDEIQHKFPQNFSQLRQQVCSENLHMRQPEQVAFLQYALVITTSWLQDKKVISDSRARELTVEGWEIFVEIAERNSLRIILEDPVNKFKDIINSLIIQNKVRLEEKNGYGFIGGEKKEDRAELIGYYDENFYYLFPTPLWRVIQKYSSDVNEMFPVSKNTLYRILAGRKLIESRGGRNLIPLRIKGRVHKVIKILTSIITEEEIEEEDIGVAN